MGKYSKLRVIVALTLMILLVAVVISACNIVGIGGQEPPPPGPARTGILAPANQTKTLVGSPVQIQSTYSNSSRIELFVRGPGDAGEKLLRADVPDNNVVVQEWTPDEPGTYTLKTVARNVNNDLLSEQSIQIEVLDSTVVSATMPEIIEDASGEAAAFDPPFQTIEEIPTPTPQIRIQVIEPQNITPTPTPPLKYPPPPPLPGIPKGPTQEQLPEKMPPVCDAAEYLGIYTADTGRRIFIPTEDKIAAKVVGGSTIHRAWRMRNIGTCTWGPGYELAFYGGRAMGSGGVVFEAAYPTNPGRPNAVINNERLIVPEGKPNQVAILEVLLNIPPTPGIHQSYWRMRNPQGVWFGPIIGVTMEVVRDCAPTPGGPRIYGAPVINNFVILGVGDVFEPDTPTDVLAEFGDTVTLEWDVINATNFDIILENPLGNVSTLSNTTLRGRAQFIAGELGTYIITMYADNGVCAFTSTVRVVVVPGDEDLFNLDIILAPQGAPRGTLPTEIQAAAITTETFTAEWNHIDPEVDQVSLLIQGYRRVSRQNCIELFGWHIYCPTVEEWVPTNLPVAADNLGAQAVGAANVTVPNISQFCPTLSDASDYGLRFVAQAQKNGRPAFPAESNHVDIVCGARSTGGSGQRGLQSDWPFSP